MWDSRGGWAEETENCYFSDLYKANGRHPEALEMAAYTAAIYCPKCPIDPMIPSVRGDKSKADLEASQVSLSRQVERGQVVSKANRDVAAQ